MHEAGVWGTLVSGNGGKMIKNLKNLKANYTVSALVCIVVGLVLVIWPGTSTQVVCKVLGGVLFAYGIIQIIMYLWAKERTLYLQGMLVLGIIFAVIGAWILLRPEMIIAAVPVIMGIIVIMHGLHNVMQAFKLKGMNYEKWWLALCLGLLAVIFGGILVYNPFKVVDTVVRVIGIFLVYNGLSDTWIISRLFTTRRAAEKEKVIDAEAVEIDEEN